MRVVCKQKSIRHFMFKRWIEFLTEFFFVFLHVKIIEDWKNTIARMEYVLSVFIFYLNCIWNHRHIYFDSFFLSKFKELLHDFSQVSQGYPRLTNTFVLIPKFSENLKHFTLMHFHLILNLSFWSYCFLVVNFYLSKSTP